MKRNAAIAAAVIAAVFIVIWINLADKRTDSPAEGASGAEAGAGAHETAPKKGALAPGLELKPLDGGTSQVFRIGGKREKPLIVNFWASWCGPCEIEAPDLKTLYAEYYGKVDLYAVNVTKFDRLRDAKQFAREQGFAFPVLSDSDGKAENAYRVSGYPTSFIIDRSGIIRERIDGVLPLKTWRKYLDEVTDS